MFLSKNIQKDITANFHESTKALNYTELGHKNLPRGYLYDMLNGRQIFKEFKMKT